MTANALADRASSAGKQRSDGTSTAASLITQPLVPMLTVLAVIVLVVIAIATARTYETVSALWAANGLAVAVWLRSGRGIGYDCAFAALMALGILAGEFLAGNTRVLAGVFTFTNTLEIVLAVMLVRRFAPTLNLATVDGTCRFIFCVGIVAPAVAGAVTAVALYVLRDTALLPTFQTWWFGHAIGLVIVGGFIISLDMRAVRSIANPLRAAETVALFGLLIGACAFTYYMTSEPLGFVMIPLLIIIAARLRVIGVTAGLIVIAILSMTALISGEGPWQIAGGLRSEQAVLLQTTILFGYVPILLVASLLEERDRLSARAKVGQLRAERTSAAKSRLLANVAHEIKSPIAGVIGIGDLWSSGQLGPVTPTQVEMADMLVRTARQVEALSHDLLDVARAESGAVKVEIRPTDVRGILEDVRRSTAMRHETRGLTLKVVCEGDGLIALADSQRLAQVVDNLATNAVKYGGSGGVIEFRARRIFDGVRIEVVDQGAGLSAEQQAQLFEPFNRLGLERSSVEGHGIGLALAKRLVELQGGTIGVTSAPGEGAIFWIELSAA